LTANLAAGPDALGVKVPLTAELRMPALSVAVKVYC